MRVLFAAVLALLAAAPAVRADTIVFRRGGDVWLMTPDGTGQRNVTDGEGYFEWPSMADDGTIAASDDAGRVHRLTRKGAPLGAPIPTAATFSTEDAPAETPTHVRISPDASKIAYDEVIDGDPTTLWTPAAATGLDFPGQTLGPQSLIAPSWLGSGQLLLSRDVSDDDPDDLRFALYTLGSGDNAATAWFNDEGTPDWATSFDAAASRTGTRIAVMSDDAADNDGTPLNVTLRLYTAAGPGAPPAFRCELALEAADTYSSASPTFSPDATRLAWAESDGIHIATLGSLSDCGAIHEQVVTLPGAWEPYWSPASDPAAPGTKKKTPTSTTTGVTLALKSRARPHRLTLRKRGLRVRVTVSAPATVRFRLSGAGVKRVATRKLANAGTTTVRLRVPAAVARTAKRIVLRATATGAKPTRLTIRPRP